MGVTVALGPPGNRLVVLVQVMQRGRAGVRGSGATGALEAAVRDVSVTALTHSGKTQANMCETELKITNN